VVYTQRASPEQLLLCTYSIILSFHVPTDLVGPGLLIIDVSGSQLDTPHWLNPRNHWSDGRREL